MKPVRYACCLLVLGSILGGCQTAGSRQEQLAAICADPANRRPDTTYFSECRALYPSSDRALQKDFMLGAPTGE